MQPPVLHLQSFPTFILHAGSFPPIVHALVKSFLGYRSEVVREKVTPIMFKSTTALCILFISSNPYWLSRINILLATHSILSIATRGTSCRQMALSQIANYHRELCSVTHERGSTLSNDSYSIANRSAIWESNRSSRFM